MKLVYIYATLVLAMLLFSCTPYTKVYSNEEPGINLYKYTTYQWLDTLNVSKGNSGPEWLTKRTEKIIRESVEQQMQRCGFVLYDMQPDLMLHYHVVIKDEVYYIPDWWCYRENWDHHGRCYRLEPTRYTEGTLILDFIEAKTGSQVWRGVVSGATINMRPDDIEYRINHAVKRMFRKFPEKPEPLVVAKHHRY